MIVVVHLRVHRTNLVSIIFMIGIAVVVGLNLRVDFTEQVGNCISFSHGIVGHKEVFLSLGAVLKGKMEKEEEKE